MLNTLATFVFAYLSAFWSLTSELAPWLLLGFFFAGLLHAYLPEEKIALAMGSRSLSSVLKAVGIGVPLPLCSCGVIPAAMSLRNSGASRGATTAFLISTPQTGVDSIFATQALLGWPLAILRPFIALVSGIIGGIAANILIHDETALVFASAKTAMTGSTASVVSTVHRPTGWWARFMSIWTYGFGTMLEDIVRWLVLGLALAALLAMVVPDDFFAAYLTNPILELGAVLLISIPLYVCATGSIPVAAVLLMKGLSPGAVVLFLMAGPATNVATIVVIGKVLGRRSLIIYLSTLVLCGIAAALVINYGVDRAWLLQGFFDMQRTHAHHGSQASVAMQATNTLSAVIILGLIALALFRVYRPFGWGLTHPSGALFMQSANTTPALQTLKVDGMTCNHCKASIENAVAKLTGVTSAHVDLGSKTLTVNGNAPQELIAQTVATLGYVVNA